MALRISAQRLIHPSKREPGWRGYCILLAITVTPTVGFGVKKEENFGEARPKFYSFLPKTGEPIKTTQIWVGKFAPLKPNTGN